jgi:hypothetical protein
VVSESSLYFPFAAVQEIAACLQRRGQLDENSLVRSFREWVRDQVARNWPGAS